MSKSKLDIKAKNLIIKKLGGEINTKSKKIEALSTKIEKEKESLAQLIRKEKQLDNTPILALILSLKNQVPIDIAQFYLNATELYVRYR